MAQRNEQVRNFLRSHPRVRYCSKCIAESLPCETPQQKKDASLNYVRQEAKTLAVANPKGFSAGIGTCSACGCSKRKVFAAT